MRVILMSFFFYCVSDTALGGKLCSALSSNKHQKEPCKFKKIFPAHMRDCMNDYYMSLSAMLDPNEVDWDFLCWSQNYMLGCRYTYEDNCLDSNCSYNTLVTYLKWMDAFTLGGKYSACGMGEDYVTGIMNNSATFLNNHTDDIKNCTYTIVYQLYTNYGVSCNDMQTSFNCLLNLLNGAPQKEPYNILAKYYRGVTSLSPCVDEINLPHGGISSIKSSAISFVVVVIITCISSGEIY